MGSRPPLSTISRRAFLKRGSVLIVTFTLGAGTASAQAPRPTGKPPSAGEVDGYLAIDRKGMVTLHSGKVELGTGVVTAMMQIVAEELSVPFSNVTVIQGDTALTPDQGPTYASMSIQSGGMQVRRAAATAREALLGEASRKLGITRSGLVVREGVVVARDGSRSIAYGDLAGPRTLALPLDPAAPLKDPKDYTIVGKPLQRVDIPAKVFGTFRFVHDVRVPGMLHARAVHPASLRATLQGYDDTPCRKIKGFVRTVRKGDFLAVVATSEWAAILATRAIVPRWSPWAGLPDEAELFSFVRASKIDRFETLQAAGDTAAGFKQAARTLQATYDLAINTHGSIGPSCAVAAFKNGQLTVWTPSQASHLLQAQLATMLQMKAENVRCIYVEGAGCYGRNGADDCSAEAALIAHTLGRPVRLQWMREDEHGWDPKGPPTLLDYRAGLDGRGEITAWESDIFLPERPMKRSGVTLLPATLADLPRFGPSTPGTPNPGLGIPYALPSSKLTAAWLLDTPLPAAWIRAPARLQNTFGNESFLDEIAAATGSDPFAIRFRLLKDTRGLELLQRLQELARWEPRAGRPRDAGAKARGRGVSYAKYELVRTYVGVVADVTVDRTTGAVQVNRVFVVHDCGQIINPDGLRNQIEGNVVQTVSRSLVEKVTFDRSAVTSLDWGIYPILTFPDVPEVVIELVDRPSDVPWGAGEPTASVIPSAIANAIFDATGARVRSVPFRSTTVLAALGSVPR